MILPGRIEAWRTTNPCTKIFPHFSRADDHPLGSKAVPIQEPCIDEPLAASSWERDVMRQNDMSLR